MSTADEQFSDDDATILAVARMENPEAGLELTVMVADLRAEGAELLLAGNSRNRTLREANVRRITDDLLSGDWTFDSSPIRVSRDGALLDGQHRLTALVRAAEQDPEITMRALVVIGLDGETQMVMDGGVRRTAGEQLGLRGVPNYLPVAACTSVINARRAKLFKTTGYKNGPTPLSHAQVWTIYQENPDLIQEAVRAAGRATRLLNRASPSAFAGLYYELAQIDHAAATDMFDRIADNRTDGLGDPVNALLRKMAEDYKAGRKTTMAQQIYLLVRCWNALRVGEKITVIRFSMNEKPFPMPEVIV